MHSSNKSEVWMERPLTGECLQYAAGDIERIAALYKNFEAAGHLRSLALLQQQSERYVSIHRAARPGAQSPFLRSFLFPLGILTASNAGGTSVCEGCARELPRDCFSVVGRQNSRAVGGGIKPHCRVCAFILAKEEYKTKAGPVSGRY